MKIKSPDNRTLADKVDPHSPPRFEKALKDARSPKAEPDSRVEKKEKSKGDRETESTEKDADVDAKGDVATDEANDVDNAEQKTDASRKAAKPKVVKKVAAAVDEESVEDSEAVESEVKSEAKVVTPKPIDEAESTEATAKAEKKSPPNVSEESSNDVSAQLAQIAAAIPPTAEKPVDVSASTTDDTTTSSQVAPVDVKAKSATRGESETIGDEAPPALADKSSTPSPAVKADAATADVEAAENVADLPEVEVSHVGRASAADSESPDLASISPQHSFAHQLEKAVDVIHPAPARPAAETSFVEQNHDTIATNVRTTLLPGGGTMHLKLDPPELGALQVSVTMRDGVMTASFQTSNDEATRLLSHSMSELKAALESQGVTVDKMQVQQSPRENSTNSDSQRGGREGQPQTPADAASQQQDQQRREMLKRMWRRVAGGGDPLDLVA